jgi:hypothetical protein
MPEKILDPTLNECNRDPLSCSETYTSLDAFHTRTLTLFRPPTRFPLRLTPTPTPALHCHFPFRRSQDKTTITTHVQGTNFVSLAMLSRSVHAQFLPRRVCTPARSSPSPAKVNSRGTSGSQVRERESLGLLATPYRPYSMLRNLTDRER